LQITVEQLDATEVGDSNQDQQQAQPRLKPSLFDGLFLLIVVLLIAGLLYKTVAWMSDERSMPLSHFILQGDLAYVTEQDVHHQLVDVEPMGTFMTQDVNQLQQAVEALEWVNRASIRKQWPDTIKIYVVEHRAAAIWNGISLLNQSGTIFHADASRLDTPTIVKLYGPEEKNLLVLETYRELEPKFEALGMRIDSLVLNDRLAWQIILENGIRLELGTEALEERLQRFISLYKKMGNKTEKISYIDLRYDTGAAVGWMPEQDAIEESDND
jgi:cell division protein FtsQ